MAFRYQMIRKASELTDIGTVFLITHKVDNSLKDFLDSTGCKVEYKFMDTSKEECLKRLAGDKSRPDKQEWEKIINYYFEQQKEVRSEMRAELRADGLHISGYVNVPGRESRPVLTPRGKVIEIIEQRAFARAIERAGGINMLLDHDKTKILASTEDGTLAVREDEVGLRAESVVTDETVINGAKAGRLKGWSFNMKNVKDSIEERTEGLPIRHVKDFDMDEITLVMNKIPVYSSTSIEVRSNTEEEVETRAICLEAEFCEVKQEQEVPKFDNTAFKDRLQALKK